LTIGKKIVKQQYVLHMSSQHGELRSTTAEIGWQVWGAPANFNGFRIFITSPTSFSGGQRNFLRCLACLLGWYTIYIFLGLLPPKGILPGAKFTLRPRFAFLCWQRYCTPLKQCALAKLCGEVPWWRGAHPVWHGWWNCLAVFEFHCGKLALTIPVLIWMYH